MSSTDIDGADAASTDAPNSNGAPKLSSSFAERFPALGTQWRADDAPEPAEVVVNDELARELGFDPAWLRSPEGTALLVGTNVPDGATPIAMAYAGHQFGGYSPLLGDGRALLLGELTNKDDTLADLHLKGSGRTPYSRGGDGLATLPAMLREYLMAEAMHALSVPTARALGVSTTGSGVQREKVERGAVLARVAASHIRVGTFEYAARQGEDLVRDLVEYSIIRHYPELANAEVPALALLEAVSNAQAKLIAQWMVLGFVHGVMNTDNVLISGETIDYGPCAFLEAHDPHAVFSSIDRQGRYAFGNQSQLGQWNLTRFAETLLPLIDEDSDQAIAKATAVLEAFPELFVQHWLSAMAPKIGLPGRQDEPLVANLARDLFQILAQAGADHNATFRSLSNVLRGSGSVDEELTADGSWDDWHQRWLGVLGDADLDEVASAMDLVNPLYIPRNHLVEEALAAASAGDLEPFHRLLEITTSPFVERDDASRYAEPAPAGFIKSYQTFCGT